MHGLLVCDNLSHEGLVVDAHDLVARHDARTLGRSIADDVLHVDGVLADGELDAHARERAFQVVGGYLHVLGINVDGVGVQLRQDERNGLLDQRVDVDRVHILVVDNMQDVVKSVAAAVDDVQAVA